MVFKLFPLVVNVKYVSIKIIIVCINLYYQVFIISGCIQTYISIIIIIISIALA